jgi:proton-dependent oligopeptide transporter, POT family
VPPAPSDPHSFLRVVRTALLAPGAGKLGIGFAAFGVAASLAVLSLMPIYSLYDGKNIVIILISVLVLLLLFGGIGTWIQIDRARGTHPDEVVDGVRSILRVLVIFALVTPFWSLFDQKASTWVIQGGQMRWPSWVGAPEMQALNPALVMILIPFNNLVIFPFLRRRGYPVTALSRMAAGIGLAGAAWVVAGSLQLVIDSGADVSLWWQLPQYALLTLGEVLVSATGLEFAYSQAPKAMKGVIMAFWSLAVTVGNLWVLLVNATVKRDAVNDAIVETGLTVTAFQMFFFAGFAFAAAAAFVAVARRYKMVDNYRVA